MKRLKLLIGICSIVGLAGPATAHADEPSGGRRVALSRTATNLVDQVMVVAKALKNRRQADEAAAPGDEASRARAERATDRGVVPAARTIYRLLKGRFGLDDEARTPERRVYLKVSPRAVGGYLRCEVRF
jgi:hypothetical protein